jgi:hypothetical protein
MFPTLHPLVSGAPIMASRPSADWPASTPEAQGVNGWMLADVLARGVLGDAVIVRHGHQIAKAGDPSRRRGWASTARGVVATPTWLVALTRGDVPMAALDRTQPRFDGATLRQGLAYLDAQNRWAYSRFWREADDLFRTFTGRTLHDYFNAEIGPILPGVHAYVNDSDGTPRFTATPLDAARWGVWMLRGCDGLVDAWLLEQALTPGPYGLEGWGGVHLIRNGSAWEMENQLHGCPDGFMARSGGSHDGVFVFPSLDLVVAAKSGAHAPDRYLPDICKAVIA